MPLLQKKTLRILGIETSCDETSIAIVGVSATSARVMHHETATQIPTHARYGGVVPEVAARLHVGETIGLLDRALARRSQKGNAIGYDLKKFDAIAVTRGPGLATALRVGIEAARTIAATTGKPIIGVNHLEGHLASSWLVPENRRHWKFPLLMLLVSGGHTELVLLKDFCRYRVIGRTRDDAAGEAFDKTAKLMGLGYPGGPEIARRGASGRADAFPFPRPMMRDGSFDFSFSGLKTAVRQTWESLPITEQKKESVVADLAVSIQAAIVEVLVAKTVAAARRHHPNAIGIVGGVSANVSLQSTLETAVGRDLPGVTVLKPARGFHTDNAAMIATAGGWHLQRGDTTDWKRMDAKPEWDL